MAWEGQEMSIGCLKLRRKGVLGRVSIAFRDDTHLKETPARIAGTVHESNAGKTYGKVSAEEVERMGRS